MSFKASAMAVPVMVVLAAGSFCGTVLAREPVPAPVPAIASLPAFDAPGVTLSNWVNSPDSERYAFLLGVVSLVDLERTWQSDKPVSLSKSLVKGWSMGFRGLTLGDVDMALQKHARNNPQDLQKPVLEIIWLDLVDPRLSEDMRKEVRNAYYGVKARKGR